MPPGRISRVGAGTYVFGQSRSPPPLRASPSTANLSNPTKNQKIAAPVRDNISPHAKSPSSLKRKTEVEVIELTSDTENDVWSQPAPKRVKTEEKLEKRKRVFRKAAPQAFQAIYDRARTQRFFVLSRRRSTRTDPYDGREEPYEEVELAGTTGNVYNVTICRNSKCTCPHARGQNQCKHIIYVMHRVLRAKFEYVYQLGLLTSELNEMFSASPIPNDSETADTSNPKNRKSIEGECPICYCEFEDHERAPGSDHVVWCRAACGHNFHKACFRTWATTKSKEAKEVTCPMCRSSWEEDEVGKNIKVDGKKVNEEGYVNVADELGISGARDYSTYSEWGGFGGGSIGGWWKYRRRR